MKKNAILFVVTALIVILIIYLESMKADSEKADIENKPIEKAVEVAEEMLKEGKYPKAPELTGISGYLNTDKEIKISDYKGKVVLIDFWTYTCINCIRTLPYLTSWDEKYRDKGLVIIGVHTPEFEFEKEKENVLDAMEKYGIKYYVVQDNDYQTWRAYKNKFWPRKYLIDSEGYIRYDHIGEGGYEETEMKIQELLSEIGEDISDMQTEKEETEFRLQTTPELYAGAGFAIPRGQFLGNAETGFNLGEVNTYTLPEEIKRDTIYLEGEWQYNEDNLRFTGNGQGAIVLDFTASEVNIVADSLTDKEIEMEIYINDKLISTVKVDKPQLYNVYDGEYVNAKLKLELSDEFSFNAFTFG